MAYALDSDEFNKIRVKALRDAYIDSHDEPSEEWVLEALAWFILWPLGALMAWERRENRLKMQAAKRAYNKFFYKYRTKCENDQLSRREKQELDDD